jgi:pyrophosphatase PpaX
VRWPFVFFDFDGTVVDTIPLITANYRQAFANVRGEVVSDELIRSWIGRVLRDTLDEVAPDDAEALAKCYIAFNDSHLHLAEPIDGMAALLRELPAAGMTTGIVTSRGRESSETIMPYAGLEDSVGLLVCGDDGAGHKPEPGPILRALELTGGAPDQAVYVGDAVVDVQSAQAAGVSSIAVTWGAGEAAALRSAGASFVVDSLAELRGLLLG